MHLFADRFVVRSSTTSRCAFDLATNRTVCLLVEARGGDEDCRRWMSEHDEVFRANQRCAELIDYGLVGQAEQFEAWSQRTARCTAGAAIDTRPAISALAELIQWTDPRRGAVAALRAGSGSDLDAAVLILARLARTAGFVPVSGPAAERFRDLLNGRSLFLIDDGSVLFPQVRATLDSPLSHVCVAVGATERPGVRRVQLSSESGHQWTRRGVLSVPRIAEQPVEYGGRAFGPVGFDSPNAISRPERGRTQPSSGELASLTRRLDRASEQLSAGRHAPGFRLLRQTVGGLARREAWTNALDGAIRLGGELLKRGRPREALRALTEAAGYAERAGSPGALLDVARLTGDAWIDSTRLDEAERVLSAALTSARSVEDRDRASAVNTSLARCLFWRAEFAAAASCLSSAPSPTASNAHAIRRLRMAARIAIARGLSADAIAALDEARLRISDAGLEFTADVEETSAFVKLAIGDYEGVDRHVAACLTAAPRKRQPTRTLSARLLQAEADRRRSRRLPEAASRALRRLSSAAPPLLKARWDLFSALCSGSDVDGVVRRQMAQSGLRALDLFSTVVHAGCGAFEPVVRDVISILEACQQAQDESALLVDVCARVRQRLRAAGVALVAAGPNRVTMAGDGARIEPEIAQRALGVSGTIAPAQVAERIEAAAVVEYGGRPLAVLCARWTIGATGDLSRAGAVISMAATAAAPIVAAFQARQSSAAPAAAPELLGVTPRIAELRRDVERAAAAPFPVLIEGESGSGKELVARAIHRAGPRRDRSFATLNCAALPDDLVEAELFGHARGAFTGAIADRAGVFEEAHGGVLFLDEIGELSARAQAKLLRVIQEGELRRIGENLARRVDVRIVAATNRDLRREVEAGRFRLDLLYRLDVVRITVPALRDRAEDIAMLVHYFWGEATRRLGSRATLAAATCKALASYSWPGNVREVQNVLASLAVRSPKRGVIPPTALPPHIAAVTHEGAFRLQPARRAFEEAFVRAALVRSGGHRGQAAGELGVSRQGLTKLMTRLHID